MQSQDDPDALIRLAQVSCQHGQFAEGAVLLRRALAADSRQARAHVLLGMTLAQLGEAQEALECFDRAIACAPQSADAHGNKGDVLAQLGRRQEAVTSYRRALALAPETIANWCNLGAVQVELGETAQALASYDRVIALEPGFAEAHFNRGNVLAMLGRDRDAVDAYDAALGLNAGFADALNNRGSALLRLGRATDALVSYQRSLAVTPRQVDALIGQADALTALVRYQDAIASLDAVIAADPANADALSNLGFLLHSLNRHDEALANLDRALAADPNHADALNNRGNVLLDLGRPGEAVQSYRGALAHRPGPGFHSNLIFALNFDPHVSFTEQQAERARWNERHARPLAAAKRPFRNRPDAGRRLRIGYVSSHFRHQAATYAFASVILKRDRDGFEAICYSNAAVGDAVGTQLRASADLWRQIEGMADEDVADLIRADGVDILVDLVGHMSGQRLLVFARKPAPVQVTGWGEPTGTGLDCMDYLLADPVLVPVDRRSLLAERVCDLPNFLGYWTPDRLPDPAALPALARGYVTFGSFNRVAKVQDAVLRCWAAILRELSSARLIIKSEQRFDDTSRRVRMDALLAEEGIAPARVEFRGPSSRAAHFAAYQEIDIALDPFPHGGGMTTLDALWMGIPVVTRPGETISSRLAAASLTALGLSDFIADDRASYVDLAVAKAHDIAALARLRISLRDMLAHSAIGDPNRYAQAVEAAYRAMWRNWCTTVVSE